MATVRRRAVLAAVLPALLAVPASARPLPSSVTILTRSDFARVNNFSVADVLDRSVGIDVEREGYRGLAARARLRGLPATESLVIMIDGRPLTHAYDGAVDLATIPLNEVERIEITRGGASVAYGPAAAGVVNVVTSRPRRDGMVVDLETGAGRDGVRQHNARVLTRFWLGDAVYYGGLQDSGGFTGNGESELTTHFINLTRSFVKGGYWGVEYSNVQGFAGTPGGSVVPFDQWNGHEEQLAFDQTGRHTHEIQTARVHAASPLVAGGTFYADVARSLRESEYLTAPSGGFTIEDQDNNSTEFRLRYDRDGTMLGVDTNHFARHLDGFQDREATQSGAFANTVFRLGELELSPGVRFDRHSRSDGALTARGTAVFRPAPSTALSASAQRGARFPTFDEIFPASGDPIDLENERIDSYDAGVAWERDRLRVALTGFDVRIDDAIAFDPAAGRLANAAEDRSRGVEMEVRAGVGHGPWREARLTASVTARHARRRDPGATGFDEAPLSPKRLAWARLDLQLPRKLTLTNEFRYESEQFELTGRGGRRLPPFGIWNVRISAAIHSALLHVTAENLGGRRYAEAFGSPAAPAGAGLSPQPTRTFWAGVSIRFVD